MTLNCAKIDSLRWASNILDQPSVKLGPAVAEEAEARAVAARGVEVERRGDHPGLGRAELGEDVAPFVADEGVAVENLAAFLADPIGGDDRHDVRGGMADHRPP